MSVIAGHLFDVWGRCSCGRAWVDIRATVREEVGNAGIAHTGSLTENEYDQIVARRGIEDERIGAAMAAVGGSY